MNTLRFRAFPIIATLAAVILGGALSATTLADEPAKAATPTSEQETQLIAILTNATLKGRWCGIKDGQMGPDKEDSYTIVSTRKLDGDKWEITARMSYGGKDVDLPIPAQVKWAGDTPVLIFDNISMGSPRTYSARLMINHNTYSGWWTATDHGGLLNGVIINGKN